MGRVVSNSWTRQGKTMPLVLEGVKNDSQKTFIIPVWSLAVDPSDGPRQGHGLFVHPAGERLGLLLSDNDVWRGESGVKKRIKLVRHEIFLWFVKRSGNYISPSFVPFADGAMNTQRPRSIFRECDEKSSTRNRTRQHAPRHHLARGSFIVVNIYVLHKKSALNTKQKCPQNLKKQLVKTLLPAQLRRQKSCAARAEAGKQTPFRCAMKVAMETCFLRNASCSAMHDAKSFIIFFVVVRLSIALICLK